jgi:uncharacterized protein YukE
MSSGSKGPVEQAADAYKWARNFVGQPLIPLPQLNNPVSDGLDAGLDHIVKAALDSTGMMDELEKVTGKLDVLTHAAQEWQARAQTMQGVAKALRGGAVGLSDQWEGSASNAFGAHMGEVVTAIDCTAADMFATAKLINQAAEECKMAEETVIEIIREAIEMMIVSLAAMVAVDIITLGLATLADALVADAEIAVFIARVARVSDELAAKLEELMRIVKEIRTASESTEETFGTALKATNNVRKLGGMVGRNKALFALVKKPSLESLGHVAATQGVRHYNEIIKGGVELVTGADDPVGATKDGLTSDTNIDATARQIDGNPGDAPYQVPRGTAREVFG